MKSTIIISIVLIVLLISGILGAYWFVQKGNIQLNISFQKSGQPTSSPSSSEKEVSKTTDQILSDIQKQIAISPEKIGPMKVRLSVDSQADGQGIYYMENFGSKNIKSAYETIDQMFQADKFDRKELKTDLIKFDKGSITCSLYKTDIEMKGTSEIEVACLTSSE